MRLRIGVLVVMLGMPAWGQSTEAITYTIDGVEHQGYLALPADADGPVPGVIVVHEWWGINDHAKASAERVAELGYVGFAVDMYGEGKMTDDPAQAGEWAGAVYQDFEAMRRIYAPALELLQARPEVDAERTASIGFCFGGTVSLEMARAGLDLDAVVSFHGGLKSVVPDEARDLSAAVLILHGGADPLVPMADLEAAMAELDEAGVDWHATVFGGALHSFTNPDAPKEGMDAFVRYEPKAAARAFGAMEAFFATVFE